MPKHQLQPNIEKDIQEYIKFRHNRAGISYDFSSIKYIQKKKPLIENILWLHAVLNNCEMLSPKLFQSKKLNRNNYLPPTGIFVWYPIQTKYFINDLAELKPKDLDWLERYLNHRVVKLQLDILKNS